MTRISTLDSPMGVMKAGGTIEAQYDVPADAWYFSENACRTMPYAVLLEAALQPCGWFASYMGCALQSAEDLYFRNLDGTATQHLEIHPDSGTLTTRVKSTGVSKAGAIIIVNFQVTCLLGDDLAFEMKTVFGFFTAGALADQAGLPVKAEDRERLAAPGKLKMNLVPRPPRFFEGSAALPGPMLMLPERITEYQEEGGPAGKGYLRAEADVDSNHWFFKSHFFGDPVQPGSLGLEALLQLLQFYMLHTGMDADLENPRFQAIATGEAMTWKYRGQVTPNKQRVTYEVAVTDKRRDEDGSLVIADVSLWVDGLRIYEATGMGMRLVSQVTALPVGHEEVLDPERDTWLKDHAPTWTVPALPMMSMVDRIAQAGLARAPGRKVVGLENVTVHRWLDFARGPRYLKTRGTPLSADRIACSLLVWHEDSARWQTVASGDVLVSERRPMTRKPFPAIDGTKLDDPYEAGTLFHGPDFRVLESLVVGEGGSSAVLNAEPGPVPPGLLNQRLLDGATHGIPHDGFQQWCADLPADHVAYPKLLRRASFHTETPLSGTVRCETRFVGRAENGNPVCRMTLIHGEQIWAQFELEEIMFPKGPLGTVDPAVRRLFLMGRQVPGVSLSRIERDRATVAHEDIMASDWLSGTLERVYNLPAGLDTAAKARAIAPREAVAHLADVHPGSVRLLDNDQAMPAQRPLHIYHLENEVLERAYQTRARREAGIYFEGIRRFWREHLGVEAWLGEDLFQSLIDHFIEGVVLEDPDDFAGLRGQGVVFLANHQTGIESLLFSVVMSHLLELKVPVFARSTHRDSWIGKIISALFAAPDLRDPELMILVDRENPAHLLSAMQQIFGGMQAHQHSLLVHAEGTRSTHCRQPVMQVSSTLIDMAVKHGVPVVPVRFSGGLPTEAVAKKIKFPIGFGKQEILIGKALSPESLANMDSGRRKQALLDAMNSVGPGLPTGITPTRGRGLHGTSRGPCWRNAPSWPPRRS